MYANTMKDNSSSFANYYKFEDGKTTIRLLPAVDKDGNPTEEYDTGKYWPFYETRAHKVNGSWYNCPKWERENGNIFPVPKDKECPVCAQAKKWYDMKMDTEAGVIYQKRRYYFNILVRGDEPVSDRVHQVEFGPQIFKQLESLFKDPEVGFDLFKIKDGIDIVIDKQQQGEYPSYKVSAARKTSDLDEPWDEVKGKMLDFFKEINYKSFAELQDILNTHVQAVSSEPSVPAKSAKETVASSEDDLDAALSSFGE